MLMADHICCIRNFFGEGVGTRAPGPLRAPLDCRVCRDGCYTTKIGLLISSFSVLYTQVSIVGEFIELSSFSNWSQEKQQGNCR